MRGCPPRPSAFLPGRPFAARSCWWFGLQVALLSVLVGAREVPRRALPEVYALMADPEPAVRAAAAGLVAALLK